MYDIYFDLSEMHQVVEDASPDELSKLYDELVAAATNQEEHEEYWAIGETFTFEFPEDDDFPVIVKKSKSKTKRNGCTCPKCGEIYPYAEPNQPDGSFKCWSCRNF